MFKGGITIKTQRYSWPKYFLCTMIPSFCSTGQCDFHMPSGETRKFFDENLWKNRDLSFFCISLFAYRYQVWVFCWLFKIKDRWNKCVLNKRTIKVCISCIWQFDGTSAPSASHLMVSLYLSSSGSYALVKLSALEGRRVSSKSPSRVTRNGTEYCLSEEGSLIFFYKNETVKNWVSGQTCSKYPHSLKET